MTRKFTRLAFRYAIAQQGKSITDLAGDYGTTRDRIVSAIYDVYLNRKCADKLLAMAEANEAMDRKLAEDQNPAEDQNVVNAPVTEAEPATEAPVDAQSAEAPVTAESTKVSETIGEPAESDSEKRLPYKVRLAIKRGTAIVDSNYVLLHWEFVKMLNKLVVPEFCIGEMKSIAKYAKTQEERERVESMIDYLEEKAEIIKVDDLPHILPKDADPDFKWRNNTFARYVQYLWQNRGFKVPYLTCSYEAGTLIKEYVKLDTAQA